MAEPNSLLACPFCGKQPTLFGDAECAQYECEHCEASGPIKETRHEARDAWNRRAGPPERGATDGKAVGSSAWVDAATSEERLARWRGEAAKAYWQGTDEGRAKIAKCEPYEAFVIGWASARETASTSDSTTNR